MTTRVGRIVLWDDDEVDDSLWMPLIAFLARARDDEHIYKPTLEHLDYRDFMLMHGIERRPRPFLYVYKHVDSRRHVNVDADGSPYRFLPSRRSGQYRPMDVSHAVSQLDPLFIRDVKRSSRCGLSHGYVDRYPPDDDWAPPPGDEDDPEPPAPRARLRLVR